MFPKPKRKRKPRPVKVEAARCCEYCASNQMIDPPHHIFPKQIGGSSRPEIHSPHNQITLCRVCHDKAHGLRGERISRGDLIAKKIALDPKAESILYSLSVDHGQVVD